MRFNTSRWWWWTTRWSLTKGPLHYWSSMRIIARRLLAIEAPTSENGSHRHVYIFFSTSLPFLLCSTMDSVHPAIFPNFLSHLTASYLCFGFHSISFVASSVSLSVFCLDLIYSRTGRVIHMEAGGMQFVAFVTTWDVNFATWRKMFQLGWNEDFLPIIKFFSEQGIAARRLKK